MTRMDVYRPVGRILIERGCISILACLGNHCSWLGLAWLDRGASQHPMEPGYVGLESNCSGQIACDSGQFEAGTCR